MPKPKPTLRGSLDPGYRDLIENAKLEVPPSEILEDPEVLAAQKINAGIAELPMEPEGEEPEEKADPSPGGVKLTGSFQPQDPYEDDYAGVEDTLGNGSTIPFKYRGRPTLSFTTCKEPEKEKNRGCPLWYRCPLRDYGPGMIAFQDTKTKQIRGDTCYNLLISGIVANTRRYHLLPGVNFHYSYEVTWKPHPDGTPVEIGPGKPKTELVKKAIKNPLVMPFEAELVRQYEVLRRHGEVQ